MIILFLIIYDNNIISILSYNKVYINLKDVGELKEKLCNYFVLERQHKEISQLCKGLESFGVLSLLKKFPNDAIKEFINIPKSITAEIISTLFPCKYSDATSPTRKLEEDVSFQWQQLLDELESDTKPVIKVENIESGIVDGKTGGCSPILNRI